MTYEWTQEQQRGLTLGSRLEHSTVSLVAGNGVRVLLAGDSQFRYTNLLDPATLQPPSIAFVQQLAKERLGNIVAVEEMDDGPGEPPYLLIGWNGYALTLSDSPTLDRFRAAVAAIVSLGGSVLGKRP